MPAAFLGAVFLQPTCYVGEVCAANRRALVERAARLMLESSPPTHVHRRLPRSIVIPRDIGVAAFDLVSGNAMAAGIR